MRARDPRRIHPILWRDEHDNPRYIPHLVKRLVTLALETRRIVQSLPRLDFPASPRQVSLR